jgi:hypothetical protein
MLDWFPLQTQVRISPQAANALLQSGGHWYACCAGCGALQRLLMATAPPRSALQHCCAGPAKLLMRTSSAHTPAARCWMLPGHAAERSPASIGHARGAPAATGHDMCHTKEYEQ